MIGKTISHYRILEKVGEGGMGIVYKAEDTKLKRTVALKFLPPELTRDPEAMKRFVQEAQAASALDHANICTIYEIDETDEGPLFIAMACYDGETLKDKIERGPLMIEEATEITTQIARGLSKAHAKGIIHRDIKPANVLINNDNEVKIIDFGLARLSGQSRLTRPHTTLGTTAYMSPEQTRGEEVDHRTDIWSLGIVLYEMLTGKLPFKGDYEQAVMYAILHEEPASIQTDITDYLKQVIRKVLKKDQNQRYQQIQELLNDLESPATSSLKSTPREKSIVVLPFVNMSPDPEQEYFSDGLIEEIITDLSHIHDLLVISRSSAMTFKGTKKKIGEIAKEVNVQYVLEGSVRKAGNNLRITAQLVEAANDAHLWAEKYSGTLDDVFDIQEKVSRSIVDALEVKLTQGENKRIAEHPIKNVQAYECYQRARQEIWRCTEDSLERAIQLLEKGIEIVGENDILLAAMGTVYFQYINMGIKADESFLKKAEEYAGRVFEINPTSSPGHSLRGLIHWKRGNVQEGVKELNRALAQDPNNPDALMLLAYLNGFSGKGFAAKPLLRTLFEIDPLTPLNHCVAGWVYFLEGQFEAALDPFNTMFRMAPSEPVFRFFYGISLAWSKQVEKALEMFDLIAKDTPEDFFARLGLFLKFALLGDKQEASKMVTTALIEQAKWDEQYSWEMAVGYALMHEKKEALDWLEWSVTRGWIPYPFLYEYDPFLENIRGEERFKKLMERVKHEWKNFEV